MNKIARILSYMAVAAVAAVTTFFVAPQSSAAAPLALNRAVMRIQPQRQTTPVSTTGAVDLTVQKQAVSRQSLLRIQRSERKPIRLEAYWWARRQAGKPYIWGGTGPGGFDCSGLIYAAYLHYGITIPRDTYEMLSTGVADGILIPVTKWQARRGDLAFYGTGHVEMVMYHHEKFPWTWGARMPGTPVSAAEWNSYWHPTAYYRIRGAGF